MSALATPSEDTNVECTIESLLGAPSDVKEPKIVVESEIGETTESSPGGTTTSTAWLVGDIVWAKIPGHPWWPSMVAYEPNTAVYFKYIGRTRYYHVQFFGHEPMRGWATEKSILLYQGKDNFLSAKMSTHGKPHKVGKKQLPLWETAIKMADKALPMNRHERKLCFTFKYNAQEAQDESPGQGKPDAAFTEILNGLVKPTKTSKDVEMSLGEPKGKRKSSSLEKSCNGSVLAKEGGTSLLLSKQSKNNAIVGDVSEDDANVTPKVKVRKKSLTKGKQSNSENTECSTQISETPPVDGNDGVSPSSLKLKVVRVNPIDPATGKRKRGRPPKNQNFVVVSSEQPDMTPPGVLVEQAVKRPKIDRLLDTSDELLKPKDSVNNNNSEQERSDVASDTNSIASNDLETKSDNTRARQKEPEVVCVVCEQPENLVFCTGVCNSAYHLDCLGLNCSVPEKFVCDECTSGNHTCFICRKTANVVKCAAASCGKFYHLDCIRITGVKVEGEKFSCPLHYCNVCGPKKTAQRRRLTSCTRCPTAYHTVTCIVAGCLPITSHYLVCKRHFLADKKKAHHSHVNVNWCFVCSMGGTLICCETCPAAFHAECIEVDKIPEGLFYCRDCTDGKELLYGEVVWVKLGMYRWWPAQICNPNSIPNNILNLNHQPGEFPVQFLGSHDYYWIHRGRVFPYQEGDKGSCKAGGKYLGAIFKKALEEAKERYADWQKIQDEKAEKDLEKLSKKPAVFKHLKVNRYTTATRYVVDESEWSVCECSMTDENPCGPDSHCLNRILLVECAPSKCPAKERCQNQCFVKRQYLKCEPFRSKGCGWALQALEDAKKGQFIIEYVGELVSDVTCRERVTRGSDEGVQNYYMLTIDKDCIIDAGPMGNFARFMNHSCDPNCETQKWTVNGEVRVGLFAKREIKAGEELVFDYQLDCLGNEKKKCACGSLNCSGFLGVRPKTQFALQLQQDKKKKTEMKKKKKKAKKNAVKDVHEDECFNCGDGGELIMCDKTGCSKCYHLSCLTMSKKPYSNWLCPWHFCDDCGKTATLRCSECSNSFCTAHAQRQITLLANGRYICQEHTSSPDPTNSNENHAISISSVNGTQVEASPLNVSEKINMSPGNSKRETQSSKKGAKRSNCRDSKSSEEVLGISSENSMISMEILENEDTKNSSEDSQIADKDSKNSEDISEISSEVSRNAEESSQNKVSKNTSEDSQIPSKDSGNPGEDFEKPMNDSRNFIQTSKDSEIHSTGGDSDSFDLKSSSKESENLVKNPVLADFTNQENITQDTSRASDHAKTADTSTVDSEVSITAPMDPPLLPLDSVVHQ